MPRYFFNVRDGQSHPDPDGIELPDLQAAKHEAIRYAGHLLSDEADSFWEGEEWSMSATNESGLLLFQLTFFATKAPAVD